MADPIITRTLVSDENRPKFLPRLFGTHFMLAEQTIFRVAEQIMPAYRGGYWDSYDLSNGGGYLSLHGAPCDSVLVSIPFGNDWSGDLSADAASIVVCLIAYSHLSVHLRSKGFGDHFHALRDYVGEHPERGLIYQAID